MTKDFKLSAEFAERVRQLVDHLEENRHGAHVADIVEAEATSVLRSFGAIQRSTPLISHGMQEYQQPLTRFNLYGTEVGLRHSQQFDKQLIVLSSQEPYCQRSGAFRPGDVGKFHTPYFNLLDFEFPFQEKSVKEEAACQKMADILSRCINQSFLKCGLKVGETRKITHTESMENFGTGDPYFDPGKDDVVLTLVFNPPLFSDCEGENPNTNMNPVMKPVFEDSSQGEAFISGKLSANEVKSLKVHGFDAIVSCPKMFSNHEPLRGLEIGGGGVRINNPDLLHRIVSSVRYDTYETYLPLLAVLKHFQNSGKYTAGGAIGLDRLCMAAAGVDQIIKIQSLPWQQDGTPNFCRKL